MNAWQLVRAVAYSNEGMTEQPINTNRGQFVDRVQTFLGLEPTKSANPWCSCFVHYCGWHGLFDPVLKTSAWPFPKTTSMAGCQHMADWSEQHNILMREPQEGDVFVMYIQKEKRFAHTGFIVAKMGFDSWLTIEGNTSKPGDTNPATMREGWGCFVRTRKFGDKDRFIRWTTLLPDKP